MRPPGADRLRYSACSHGTRQSIYIYKYYILVYTQCASIQTVKVHPHNEHSFEHSLATILTRILYPNCTALYAFIPYTCDATHRHTHTQTAIHINIVGPTQIPRALPRHTVYIWRGGRDL